MKLGYYPIRQLEKALFAHLAAAYVKIFLPRWVPTVLFRLTAFDYLVEKWAMEFSKQLLKEMLGSYLNTTFSQILPDLIKESFQNSDLLIGQDFVCLEEATRRFHLCRKTLYNYHNKGYITLHSSEGKTFVSIRELESHIRKHPLPRNLGMKMAA